MQRLQALGRESRLSLRSVQPYLMAAYNRCSAQLEQGDFLFVLAEPRRSVLLLAAGGAWQQVLAQGCADSDQALQALIERTCELYGEHLPRVYLHAPGRGDVPQLAAVQLCPPASEADPCAPCGGRWPDMRRLDLEFQPRRNGPWPGRCSCFCCCDCLPGAAATYIAGRAGRPGSQCAPLGVATGAPPGLRRPLSNAASREQAERLAQMKSVSQQLQRPWQQLFSMLEAMPQDDVALLGLTPDARKGQVRISAEARNLEAMLQYHKRLEASEELSDVSLLNHEVLAAQPEHPVRFTLTATWETGHARP